MAIIHTVTVNLEIDKPNDLTVVHAVQGEYYTRQVTANLFSKGIAYQIPTEAVALIRYRKPDGTVGFYDFDPDGNRIVTIPASPNNVKVIFTLAPEMCDLNGRVYANIDLYSLHTGYRLSVFNFIVDVEKAATDNEVIAESNTSGLQDLLEDIIGNIYRGNEDTDWRAGIIDNTLTIEGAVGEAKAMGEVILVQPEEPDPEDHPSNKIWIDSDSLEEGTEVPDMDEFREFADQVDNKLDNIVYIDFPNVGYIDTAGELHNNGSSHYSNMLLIDSNKIKYSLYQTSPAQIGLIVFYDLNGSVLSVITNEPSSASVVSDIVDVPEGAVYFRASKWDNVDNTYCGYYYDIEYIDSKIKMYDENINDIYIDFPNVGYIDTAGELHNNGSSHYSDLIKITSNTIEYALYQTSPAQIGLIVFYDLNGSVLSVITNEPSSASVVSDIVDVPEGAVYFRASKWNANGYVSFCKMNNYKEKIGDLVVEDEINKNNINSKISYPMVSYDDLIYTGYIGLNGIIQPAASYKNSGYYPISKKYCETISYTLVKSAGSLLIAFYDKYKVFISGIEGSSPTALISGECQVPDNAEYFIIECYLSGDPNHVTKAIANINLFGLFEDQGDSSLSGYLYGDSIMRPFSFDGKTALAFGDSITDGVANEGSGNIPAGSNSYINRFAAAVGLTLTNKAVSGSTITYVDNEQYNSLYTVITNTSDSADFIIIAGGVNDYVTGRTIGQFGDNTKYTLYGALKLICEYLQTNYSNTKVIFITPINVTKDFGGRSKEMLDLYRNAIFEVATYYGYNVVDGRDMIPVTQLTGYDDTMISHNDGCHPTLRGHAMYSRNLCMKLAGYTDLNGIIAEYYDSTKTYSSGDYCIHYDGSNDKLYKCTTNIDIPENWNSSHWTEVVLSNELSICIRDSLYAKETVDYIALREEEDRQILMGSVAQAVEDEYTELRAAPIHTTLTVDGSVYPRLDNTRLGLDAVKGRTVAFNQLCNSADGATKSDVGVTITYNGDGKYSFSGTATSASYTSLFPLGRSLFNHVCLFTMNANQGSSGLIWFVQAVGSGTEKEVASLTASTFIFKPVPTSATGYRLCVKWNAGTVTDGITVRPNVFDLTSMYNGAIDSLSESDAIAYVRARLLLDYYAFNAGTLTAPTVSGWSVTGFNQWDEEWEVGDIDQYYGQNNPNAGYWRCKNYIPVLPNEKYYYYCSRGTAPFRIFWYDANKNFLSFQSTTIAIVNGIFTVPNNAYYLRFRYAHAHPDDILICINISNASLNGTYRPYVAPTALSIPSTTLNGVGSAQDYIEAVEVAENDYSLVKTAKMALVDLGTLTWLKGEINGFTFFDAAISGKRVYPIESNDVGLVCAKYPCGGIHYGASFVNGYIYEAPTNNFVYIADNTYASSTEAQFKTAMSGVYCAYPLATPTQTTVAEHLTLAEVSAIAENGDIISIVNSNGDIVQPDAVFDTVISRSAS